MSKALGKLEFVTGTILLAIITVLVFIAAIMRFFGHPLIWSIDMAQLLFIWLCFIGASRAMRQRSHLGVDFLMRNFTHPVRLIVETALSILILGFLMVLTWEGYKLTVLNMERLFGDFGLSYAYVTIAVPAGSILLSFAIITNLIEAWRGAGDGRLLVFLRSKSNGGENRAEL